MIVGIQSPLSVDPLLYSQAQPEHGVYTVFINVGNTKIEVWFPTLCPWTQTQIPLDLNTRQS
jgi:hypothetical protein